MKHFIRRTLAGMLAVAAVGAVVAARAETYPSRPVRLIVAYAPGGTGDIVARVISDRLAIALGQPVVVENRPGATGAIGTQAVVSAAPDGHTLLVGQTGEIAINQHWSKTLSYDPARDLLPIALASVVPLALVIPGSAPYRSIAELLHSAGPRGLSFASSGTATPGYFAGELLKLRTNTKMTHVPYKGAGPALNDLLGAHVDLFFSGFPPVVPHVKAGTLKLLAVSSATRSPVAPETPTVAEVIGARDFDITLWQGFFAPRGTPKDIVDRLNGEINKILSEPDIKEKLLEAGAQVTTMSVDQFAAFTAHESDKYLRIIKDAGLTPD